MQGQSSPDPIAGTPADERVDVDIDAEDDLAVPLDVPIETPVADLIDQRRPVPVDETDER